MKDYPLAQKRFPVVTLKNMKHSKGITWEKQEVKGSIRGKRKREQYQETATARTATKKKDENELLSVPHGWPEGGHLLEADLTAVGERRKTSRVPPNGKLVVRQGMGDC